MKLLTMLMTSALCLGAMTGCGINNESKTLQKTIPREDRYIAKEYNTHRAYTYDHQKNNSLPLEIRLANEAERIYTVKEAVAVRQGHDILMGIVRHAHPLYPKEKIETMIRERLENHEPTLSGYNLYLFVNDPTLQQQLYRVKTNQENSTNPEFIINTTEPTFNDLLQTYKKGRGSR